MNDLEINKALALAIGWHGATLKERDGHLFIQENERLFGRAFSHMDWNVIGPIAANYDCFPVIAACDADQWVTMLGEKPTHYFADTPQKAIALAVIGAKK